MSVCMYYMRGNCKYGNRCKFQHSYPYNEGYNSNYNQNFNQEQQHSTSILRQAQQAKSFISPPQTQSGEANETTVINSVKNDMLQAEHGHQWPFSSYHPFKGKPSFPGFDDQSFEEARYEFYLAEKHGFTVAYKQQWKELYDGTILKFRALQNPSIEFISIIKDIYYNKFAPASSPFTRETVQFPQTQQQPQQQQNIFQQQPFQHQQQPFQVQEQFVQNQHPSMSIAQPFQQFPQQQQQQPPQQQQQVLNENTFFYSDIEQLTMEEKSAFENQFFTAGLIPEKPPALVHIN